MISKNDVDAAEQVEQRAWELQFQAHQLASELVSVVHHTAQTRRLVLGQEVKMVTKEKAVKPERVAYARARALALSARLKLQLVKTATKAKQLQVDILEFSKEIDLGPLLDSCPE